jgi:hypothetical protein
MEDRAGHTTSLLPDGRVLGYNQGALGAVGLLIEWYTTDCREVWDWVP